MATGTVPRANVWLRPCPPVNGGEQTSPFEKGGMRGICISSLERLFPQRAARYLRPGLSNREP